MKGPQTRADVAAKVQSRFSVLDTNKDGFVTRQESEAAMAARFGQRFDRLDGNKNGTVTPEVRRQMWQSHRQHTPKAG